MKAPSALLSRLPHPGPATVMPVVILLAFGLRLFRWMAQPLWADEGYSFYFAGLSPFDLLRETAGDIHPPLYYMILRIWFALAGWSDASARLFSILVGTLTVTALFGLARRLTTDARTSALAALLLALAPLHIFYSQEVRMYALATLWAVLSTTLTVRWVQTGSRHSLLAAVVFVIVNLYTLYYGAFIPIGLTVLVAVLGHRERLVAWLRMMVVCALVYMPWLLFAGLALASYVGRKIAIEGYTPLALWDFLATVGSALVLGHVQPALSWLSATALVVAGLWVVGLIAWRQRAALGVFALVATPLFLGWIVNLAWPFHPPRFERLFLYALPWLCVGVAAGLGTLIRAARPALLIALLLIGATGMSLADFYTTPRYPRDDYRPLIRRIVELGHPDDTVVALYPWQIGFVRAYDPERLPFLHAVSLDEAQRWAADPAVLDEAVAAMLRRGRLWFLSYEAAGRVLEQRLVDSLMAHGYPAVNGWAGDHRVFLFVPPAPASQLAMAATFGNCLQLNSVAMRTRAVEAGRDAITVELLWTVTAPASDASVSLQLVPSGLVRPAWVERVSRPQDGRVTFSSLAIGQQLVDRHALPLPADIPPGRYDIRLSLFDVTGRRTLALSSGAASLVIGSVDVRPARVAPDTLVVAHRGGDEFGGILRLEGYDLPASDVRPGLPFLVDTVWRAVRTPVEDLRLFVQAQDGRGKVWALYEAPGGGGRYPTDAWPAGAVVRERSLLVLPPDAPPGTYRIIAGWLHPDGRRLLAGGRDAILLGQVTAQGWPHTSTLSALPLSFSTRVGDGARLMGLEGMTGERQLLADVAVPASVDVRLWWRADGRIATRDATFVHVVGAEGRIYTQWDGEASVPTSAWLPGDVVSMTVRIDFPAGMPPGDYRVLVGMYDPDTGVRRLVEDGSDAVLVGFVRIQ